jgi:hypothetical protein
VSQNATKDPVFSAPIISNIVDPLAPIRYSCVFWFGHLCVINNQALEEELADNGRVFTFFEEHFLHWIESLSAIRQISDSVLIIKSLLDKVQVS